MMASSVASGRASRPVATADTAAVLISVIAEAFRIAERLAGPRAGQQHDALVRVQADGRVAAEVMQIAFRP